MRDSSSTRYPQDLPYCLSSSHSDPSSDFAKKKGWLSPSKLFEYAYPTSSDSGAENQGVNSQNQSNVRKHTFKYASRSYIKLFRLVFSFTIGCLTAIVLYQLFWPSSGHGPSDPFDDLFPLRRPSPDGHGEHGEYGEAPEERLEAFMHNVLPVRCHSHNDYWRRTPLYAAIGSGCISVEADVWSFDDDLYVGHNTGALKREATLSLMYLEPIEKMLRSVNTKSKIGNVETNGHHGVFRMDPSQTLVLLIDFKTEASATYDKVYAALSNLREAGWLTHWNGTDRVERPLTVVVSGNVPFDRITENKTYRDIFCDAPLNKLVDPTDTPPSAPTVAAANPDVRHTITDLPAELDPNMLNYKYNPSNSYYASTDLKGVVGFLNQYSITPSHIETLKKQIREARVRGLVPRYWGTPRWPRNFRDYIWEILMESEVGVINVDDLRAARKGNWGRWVHQDPRQ